MAMRTCYLEADPKKNGPEGPPFFGMGTDPVQAGSSWKFARLRAFTVTALARRDAGAAVCRMQEHFSNGLEAAA